MRDPANRQQRERDGQITGHTTGHDRDGRARAYDASWLRTRQWQTYGRVWIGTSQGNLWGYDGSRWLSFEASDGTDGNAVNCIQEDDTLCLGVTNRVWFTSTASASSAQPCRRHDAISQTGAWRMWNLSSRLMTSACARCRSGHRMSGMGTPRYPASPIVVLRPCISRYQPLLPGRLVTSTAKQEARGA